MVTTPPSPGSLRFDDRVVLITGAASGLGRDYALAFAARGAIVVVNDVQGANTVVAEIEALGGRAVADDRSVELGDEIVAATLQRFGRIDILVNNAGFLRDASFAKMTPEQWESVLAVHLTGAVKTTRAAWPSMREAGFGRIIMTTSATGLYGNAGQANYGAAKMALLGLSNTLALEGRRSGVLVNSIAPVAASGMTGSAFAPEALEMLQPKWVTPLVLWLAHADSLETGGLFEIGGGWVAQLRWQRSIGVALADETPEALKEQWSEIVSFKDPEHPSNVGDTFSAISRVTGFQIRFANK
jgi:3-hydroxyacyl-CoA dehydrogenase/3a,7a,12a-trihydroxy-5b-cholest-24-enoyl-CoA hydratase